MHQTKAAPLRHWFPLPRATKNVIMIREMDHQINNVARPPFGWPCRCFNHKPCDLNNKLCRQAAEVPASVSLSPFFQFKFSLSLSRLFPVRVLPPPPLSLSLSPLPLSPPSVSPPPPPLSFFVSVWGVG